MIEIIVRRRAARPRAIALFVAPLALWSVTGCAPTPAPTPPPVTPAAVPAVPAPAPAATPVAAPSPTGRPRRPTARRASTCRSCRGTICSRTTASTGASTSPGALRSARPAAGSAAVKDGQLCVDVTNKGVNGWDVAGPPPRDGDPEGAHLFHLVHGPRLEADQDEGQGRHVGTALQGVLDRHRRSDDASADASWARSPWRAPTTRLRSSPFTSAAAMAGETAAAPYTVCLDDIHLDDPQFAKAKTPDGRRGADPERARQPDRLPARSAQAGDHQDHRRRRRCRGSSRSTAARWWPRARRSSFGKDVAVGRRRAGRRLLGLQDARQGLHARGSAPTSATPSTSARTSTRSSSTTRWRIFITPAAASRSRCPTRAASSGRARRATSAWRRTRGTRACPASRARAATTSSTSPAAGTTPAITASTSSTAASPSGRCMNQYERAVAARHATATSATAR